METERSYSITSLSFLMLCVAIIIAAAMIRGGREAPEPESDPYEHAVACCPCDLTINGDKRIFEGFMMRDTSCECPVVVVDLPEN